MSGETIRAEHAAHPLRRLLFSLILFTILAPAFAEQPMTGDRENGAKLFKRYCKGCHGEKGEGGGLVFMPHVNNLTKKGYIEKLPDEFLLLAIAKGGPGIGKSSYMPAWEDTLTQQEMWDLIAHIRSLPTY
jgi:mono/diheme cytochrome c family protein